jgi:hypothetical protein
MKAVVYDGAASGDDTVATIADHVCVALQARAYTIQCRRLRAMDVGWCRGCFGCWVQSPGLCVIDDDGRTLAADYVGSDLAVFTTRITFGGHSACMKRAIDRLLCLLSVTMRRDGQYVRHAPRYERMPRLLVVGVAPLDKEEAELFRAMVAAQGHNLHAPRTRAIAVPAPAELEHLLPQSLRELEVQP